jgi:CRISPR-associated protein Csb2
MPTLIMTFPSRRYHATPWGHHVNEGLIEWPPSPWRLLRALLSVGYTKGFWGDGGPSTLARDLFAKLSGVLPEYSLPQAIGAHSRHYMPLGVLDKGREKTTLVFDTWAQIDHGTLAITWKIDLTDDERGLLAELAAKLGYLGRAESWVEARLAKEGEELPVTNSYPNDTPPGLEWEQVSLLAPQDTDGYALWRQQAVAKIEADYPPMDEGRKQGAKEKKLLDQRDKALSPYPLDLLDAMQKETAWQQGHGWSQPPGSQRVLYWRRRDAFRVGVPVAPVVPIVPPVKAMLLSIATATGNKHALPPVIYTLIQGERLHKALVAKAGRYHCVLSGCDESGKPLGGRHDHAHIIPLDLDHDGQLDHFLVWASMGLDGAAQQAVRAIRKTFAKNDSSLHLALAACCAELSELESLPGTYGDGLRATLGMSGAADWISRTPFVPPRHLKPRGKNSLEGQIMAELESRGFPEPVEVTIIDPRESPEYLRHRHFTRIRKLGPPPAVDCGFTIKLRFAEPLSGPLALGYACHYGLGLFAPVAD